MNRTVYFADKAVLFTAETPEGRGTPFQRTLGTAYHGTRY